MKETLLTGLVILLIAQDAKQDYDPEMLLKRVESGPAKERAKAVSAVRQWRKQMIPRLVELASEPEAENKRNWSKRAAIELLAELRADSAAPALVRDIDLPPGPFEDGPIGGRATLYPCAKALVSIGMPATRELFSALKARNDVGGLKLELFVDVLARIYGSREVAAFAVELEAKKTDEGNRPGRDRPPFELASGREIDSLVVRERGATSVAFLDAAAIAACGYDKRVKIVSAGRVIREW